MVTGLQSLRGQIKGATRVARVHSRAWLKNVTIFSVGFTEIV